MVKSKTNNVEFDMKNQAITKKKPRKMMLSQPHAKNAKSKSKKTSRMSSKKNSKLATLRTARKKLALSASKSKKVGFSAKSKKASLRKKSKMAKRFPRKSDKVTVSKKDVRASDLDGSKTIFMPMQQGSKVKSTEAIIVENNEVSKKVDVKNVKNEEK